MSDSIKNNINISPESNGNLPQPQHPIHSKGNEDKKIFVGGIPYEITDEDLSAFFEKFGKVNLAQVKYDRLTQRSRGFAFVEFAESDGCENALRERVQSIKDKQIEVKPAKSRENKKVFVGGLPADFPEDQLRTHFEEFGKVEDIEWPYDKGTKAHKNFAFIVFEEENAADRAAQQPKQTFGNRDCDVKKAVPQGKRFLNNPRVMPAIRGGMYQQRNGYPINPNPANWAFQNNGWSNMYAAMPAPNGPNGWSQQENWNAYPAVYSQNGASYPGYQQAAGPTYDPTGYNNGRNNNLQRFPQAQFQ
uniref:RNA-binding protein squid n=1 Tax=Rhabditophanes sp. KR3021 TaxID=114890 RepID=A0AC35TYN5_9BILA